MDFRKFGTNQNPGSTTDYEPVKPSRLMRQKRWQSSQVTPTATETTATKIETNSATVPASSVPKSNRLSSFKRGHGFTYLGLFIFTILLYFRPYEYFSSAQWLQSSASWTAILTLVVFFATQLALEGNLMQRPREVNHVLLLTVCGLLSIPLATSPAEAWDKFNDPFIKAVLIFIVIVNVVRSPRRLWGLFFLSLAVSCLLSVNALRDYSSGKVVVEGYRVMGSIGGLFANPNDMALHLVTVVPIAVALGLTTRNIFLKIIYWSAATLLVAAITVTYSRGGFLALIAVAGVLAWKLGRSRRLAVTLIVAFGTLAFISLAPGNYGLRLASIFIPGLDPNGSSTSRRDLLQRSILVALRYPLFGVGMGNFHHRGIQELGTHNAYTQVASELGLFAAFIYLKFLLGPLRRLRAIEQVAFPTRRESRLFYLAVGLQASLIGYMVASFFASVAFYWYVYYIVGYAVCFRRLYEVQTGLDVEALLAQQKLEKKQKKAAKAVGLTPAVPASGAIHHEY